MTAPLYRSLEQHTGIVKTIPDIDELTAENVRLKARVAELERQLGWETSRPTAAARFEDLPLLHMQGCSCGRVLEIRAGDGRDDLNDEDRQEIGEFNDNHAYCWDVDDDLGEEI